MSIKEKVSEEISEAVQDVKESLPSKGRLLDKLLGKLVSRKLTVFLTATGLLVWSGLDPETWGMIAMFYIGGQSIIDAAKAWRHG